MAIDWDRIVKDMDEIIKGGAKKADERLASIVSSGTRMTDDEVKELFPQPADVKKLGELMQIVKAAHKHNTKVNNIVENAKKFGGVILTLLDRFV